MTQTARGLCLWLTLGLSSTALSITDPLTFCLDKGNPMWPLEEAVAREIAKVLKVGARVLAHREEGEPDQAPDINTGFDVYETLFRDKCNVYMGLSAKMPPKTSMYEFLLTKPYYHTRYVLVSRNPAWQRLEDVPKGPFVGYIGKTLAASLVPERFRNKLNYYPTLNAYTLLEGLEKDKIAVGVVGASVLYGLMPDPQGKGFAVYPFELSPFLEWPVAMAVGKDRNPLRERINSAVETIIANGRMSALLEDRKLPRQFFRLP